MSKLLPPTLAILLFLVHGTVFSQQGKETLIIANDSHNVNIFFPDIISKFILGSPNFKFTHEPNTQIGSLQSKKGKDSNLTVITNDGNIYSFLLQYGDKITDFNIFIDSSASIGNMKKGKLKKQPVAVTPEPIALPIPEANSIPTPTPTPSVITPDPPKVLDNIVTTPSVEKTQETPIANEDLETNAYSENQGSDDLFIPPPSDDEYSDEENDLYNTEREEYYRIFCENNFMQPSYIKRTFTTSKNIILRINNILGDRNELYFVLQIENNSKSNYETDFLNFFMQRKSAKDQVLMEPLYKYNLKDVIEQQSINEVVYVFKKFKINPKEKVVIVLDEKDGRRTLVLSIFDKQVNTIKI